MESDVGKLHSDSLIMTIYEGTSEIQASFALKEMGKGALAVVFEEVRAELATMADDPARAPLAARVEEMTVCADEASQLLFADPAYALLRAKLMAEMVIDVITAAELLAQVEADPARLDLVESFIRRRVLEAEHMGRRIAKNAEGHLERDARVLAQAAPVSA